MALRALLLDLDGTLIDSNPLHVAAWQTALEAHGFPFPDHRIAVEIGKGGDHLIRDLLGPEVDDRQGDALREAHRRAYLGLTRHLKIAVLLGARELIAACKRRGIPTALATSSTEEHLDAAERASGVTWRKLVDITIGADDVAQSKPSPDIVAASASQLSLPAADCALVGDTPWDAMATYGRPPASGPTPRTAHRRRPDRQAAVRSPAVGTELPHRGIPPLR